VVASVTGAVVVVVLVVVVVVVVVVVIVVVVVLVVADAAQLPHSEGHSLVTFASASSLERLPPAGLMTQLRRAPHE